MCGLAGLVILKGRDPVPSEAEARSMVASMCDVVAHRGPDDSGVEAVGPIVLGSRRLAIIDLSAAGHMPMGDASGRWWIAYNGEVYNFAEIRAELSDLGHCFRSHSDSEVVLHAWMQWGRDCLPRFTGMFAFAIADTVTGDVFLVRDRFGIKPLYYARVGNTILFASEVKALSKVGRSSRIDQRSLAEWLLYRSVDSVTPETLIEGIESLLPGHVATISGSTLTTSTWYSPIDHVSRTDFERYSRSSPDDVVEEIDGLLNDAVRLRLISDVPVGTLLSGGLDSSLITSMAAGHTPHLHTFHVSVEDFPAQDERRYAEQLTDRLQLPFIPLALTGRAFRRELARTAYLSDLPLSHPNTVAYSLICRAARRHGVIVLLSGEGADELFGGYSWNYRRRLRLMRLERWLRLVPKRLHDVAALLVYSHAGLPVAVRRFREVLPPTVDFLDRFARRDWLERCEEAYTFAESRASRMVLGSMLADLSDFLTPLLRRLDRASMGASVECRVPFLDHRLVHRAINMPLEYRVGRRADKWILKRVARKYVPRQLIARRKAGFPLPFDAYLRPLADVRLFAGGFCEQVLGLSPRGLERALAASRHSAFGSFALVALEVWGRIHVMAQPVEFVEEAIAALEPDHTPTE